MTHFFPNALCFGEEFPAAGAPCLVQVEEHGLTVTFNPDTSAGPPEVAPFSELSVSAGGIDHDHLVVKWIGVQGERTLYLKNPDLIRSFREAVPDHLNLPLTQVAEQVRQVRHRRQLVWGIVGGVILSTVLGLWLGADLLVEVAVSRIPVEWEQKLGESAYRDFLINQEVVKEGSGVGALEEMTRRLTEQIQNNPYKFQVTVVKSDVVNAFALPGGYVVVFTGLMKKAESGEEVAGVLSHELSHVLQRHGLERIVKRFGLFTVISIIVGNQQGLVGLMREIRLQLFTLRFSREQETEADITGVRLLHRAAIDPGGMIRFFERMSEKDRERVELLSTHPMSQVRAARLKAEVAALPKQVPESFTFDWKAVHQSLPRSCMSCPHLVA